MKSVSLLILLLTCNFSFAQLFKPDSDGYVSDPKFHKLIKERNYQLVGAFDTISTAPLEIAAQVLKAGKWSYIDRNGKVMSKAVPYATEIDNWMTEQAGTYKIPFKKISVGNKYGLADLDGHVIIPAIYDFIDDENVGVGIITVKLKYKWGVLSTNGTELLPLVYDEISTIPSNDYHVFLNLQQNDRLGVFSAYKQKIIVPLVSDMLVIHYKDIFITSLSNKIGAYNSNGDEVIPMRYSMIQHMDGNIYTLFAKTAKGTKYGMVNIASRAITEPVYDDLHLPSGGRICISQHSLYGYLDTNGKEIIPPIYQYANPFTSGMAVVVKDGKYGVIDLQGNFIAQPIHGECKLLIQYPDGEALHNRLVFFPENDKARLAGIMDFNGKVIIPAIYNTITFEFNKYIVQAGDKFGMLNASGKVLLPVRYNSISGIGNDPGIYDFVKDGKEGQTDFYGNEMIF